MNGIVSFARLVIVVGVLLALMMPVLGQEAAVSPSVTVHVVQRGETLFRIAQTYGVTLEEIALANDITDPSNILVGQRLIIPVNGLPEQSVDPQTHIVQPGETLFSIATLYSTTPAKLAEWNNITLASIIYAGQSLIVSSSRSSSTDDATVTITHVVQRGETLFAIALQHGVTMQTVQEANEIADASLIYAGQHLTIPDARPPRIALEMPEIISDIDITPVFFVEGQAGRVRLTTTTPASVAGTFMDRTLTVFSTEDGLTHTILVAIPILIESAIYPMTFSITLSDGRSVEQTINIRVLSGGYGTQNIELPADQMALLSPGVEENELTILRNLTSTITPERYFDGLFGLPAAAIMNAPYGTRRSYNGGAVDHYHNGADFAGAPGSPIFAAAPGQVVLADTLHIRGISVVIDHGWGVYTNYAHMTERLVTLGQFVTAGQQIGTIGKTGRATGAHLHWEVWLNGVSVDPMQWARQPFP